jgi:copper homeostasis protein
MVMVEVSVDSVEGALAAAESGATRIELCQDLFWGGTTPSAGMVEEARLALGIPMNVIIRPRGGDFCYSGAELRVMRRDIALAKELGADGVVLGLLTSAGDVDVAETAKLILAARPMTVTFHRAFDDTRDPHLALADCIQLGVDRVLTTGQEATPLEGAELIRALVEEAAGRTIVMPAAGGDVPEHVLARIVRETGVSEISVCPQALKDSPMKFRNSRCFMGGQLRPPEYQLPSLDADRVRGMVAAVASRL